MNKMQKGKAALIGIAVVLLILDLVALGLGIALVIAGPVASGNTTTVMIVEIVIGAILIIGALLGAVPCFTMLFTGLALHATKGTYSEQNLAHMSHDVKKCPKCGCTNTVDATECASCHTPLE